MNAILLWSLQTVVMTSIMVPIVMAVCQLVRDRPAIQHALWLVVLLKFLTPSIIAWPWSLPEIRTDYVSSVSGPVENNFSATSRGVTRADEDSLTPSVQSGIEGRKRGFHQVLPDISALRLVELALMSVWIIGSLAFVVRQYQQLKRQTIVLSRGVTAPPELSDLGNEVARQFGLKPIPLLIVPNIASPFVWCWGRLKLAWPSQIQCHRTNADVRSIMAHEFAHVCRKDHWVAWLELVAGGVWWWNPIFWFANQNLRASADMACDALALESYPEERYVYAVQLLEQSTASNNGVSPLALSVSASSSRLFERRMSMIVSESTSGNLSASGIAVTGLLAIFSMPTWSFGEANVRQVATAAQDGAAKQAAANQPAAEAKPSGTQNFAVFPIKTALQRRLLGWPIEDRANALAYVIINVR